jgi:hypothetical protein
MLLITMLLIMNRSHSMQRSTAVAVSVLAGQARPRAIAVDEPAEAASFAQNMRPACLLGTFAQEPLLSTQRTP